MPLGCCLSARLASRRTAVRGQTVLQTQTNTALGRARTFGVKHSRGLPPVRSPCQRPDGSPRANGTADANEYGTWQSAHLWCETQLGASALPLAVPAAGRQSAGKRYCKRKRIRHLAERAPSVRNTAGGFRPSARRASRRTAVRGQTALQTQTNTALGRARTFGVKHSRGLPPIRSPCQRPDGSPRANGTANANEYGTWQSAHLRCETQPGASAHPLTMPAVGRQSAGKRYCKRKRIRHLAERAPSVRNTAGGFRPSAGGNEKATLRWPAKWL
jgi:hypothetical protein